MAFVLGGADFLQLDSESLLIRRDSHTCQVKQSTYVSSGAAGILSASSESGLLVGKQSTSFFHLSRSSTSPMPVVLDSPIEELSLAPDGDGVVVLSAQRVLRIPLSLASAMEVARRRISREFTTDECMRFFPGGGCPTLLELK